MQKKEVKKKVDLCHLALPHHHRHQKIVINHQKIIIGEKVEIVMEALADAIRTIDVRGVKKEEEVEKDAAFHLIQRMTKQIIENIMKNIEVGPMRSTTTENDTHRHLIRIRITTAAREKNQIRSIQRAVKNIHHPLATIPLTMKESTSESTKEASTIEIGLKI